MPRSYIARKSEPFSGIVANLPAALYTTDAEGVITYFNEAAAIFWGRRPDIGVEKWCGSWKLFTLDGAPLAHSDCPMAVAIRTARPVRGAQAIAERPDGTRVPFQPFPTPLFNSRGEMTGALNVLIEIADFDRQRHGLKLVAVNDDASSHAHPAAAGPEHALAIAALFDQTARMLHPDGAKISPLQWAVLRYLARSRHSRAPAEIAAFLGGPKASATRAVGGLVRMGLVDSLSLRGVNERLKLTARGRDALKRDPVLRLADAVSGVATADRAGFAAGLEAVAGRLEPDRES